MAKMKIPAQNQQRQLLLAILISAAVGVGGTLLYQRSFAHRPNYTQCNRVGSLTPQNNTARDLCVDLIKVRR